MRDTLSVVAGRELDERIAVDVMGWLWKRDQDYYISGYGRDDKPIRQNRGPAYRFLVAPDSMYAELPAANGDEQVRHRIPRALPPEFPHYSTATAAAWLVVEKMTTEAEGWERWSFGLFFDSDPKQWSARFAFMMMDARGEREYPLYEGEADADTVPMAICLAALASVAASQKAPV